MEITVAAADRFAFLVDQKTSGQGAKVLIAQRQHLSVGGNIAADQIIVVVNIHVVKGISRLFAADDDIAVEIDMPLFSPRPLITSALSLTVPINLLSLPKAKRYLNKIPVGSRFWS